MKGKEQNGFILRVEFRKDAQLKTYRKDNRNATSYGFGAVQVSFVTEEQIFFAACRLPGDYGRSIEEDFDPITSGQGGDDTRIIVRDRDLWSGRERGDGNGGWLLAFNHLSLDFLGQYRSELNIEKRFRQLKNSSDSRCGEEAAANGKEEAGGEALGRIGDI